MLQSGIFSRAFWREYRLSLLRSKRDARSRKMFLRLNLALLLAIVWVAYELLLLHSLHDTGTTIGVVAVLMVILAVIGGVRLSHWREEKRILAQDIASAPSAVVTKLQHLTHGLAAIQERALSELYLHNHHLPDNAEVITRRIQISALKQRGSWEELPLVVRDWIARPDGTWTKEEAVAVTLFAETLHTLLWAQALLPRLRPLDSVMDNLDFAKLSRALQRPALGILPTWELRIERNAANLYFSRCLAERIKRGDAEVESEDQQEAMNKWLDEIHDGTSPEFFSGTAKVSELEKDGLQRISHSTAQRTAVLASVMVLLDGENCWENLEGLMFAALKWHVDSNALETNQEGALEKPSSGKVETH